MKFDNMKNVDLKNESPNDAKPLLVAVHLEDEPYCHNCGEDEHLKYNEQYANGEYWTCKTCGDNFFYTREHCL